MINNTKNLDVEAVISSIKGQDEKGLSFRSCALVGDDLWGLMNAKEKIENAFQSQGLTINRFFYPQTSSENGLNHFHQPSLFSEKEVVVICFEKAKLSTLELKGFESFLKTKLTQSKDYLLLVDLSESSSKLAKNWLKCLEKLENNKNSYTLTFDKPRAYNARTWLLKTAKNYQIKLKENQITTLTDLAQLDSNAIGQVFKKMSFISDTQGFENLLNQEGFLESQTNQTFFGHAFDVLDAFYQKNPVVMGGMMEKCKNQPEIFLPMFKLLQNEIRRLIVVKEGFEIHQKDSVLYEKFRFEFQQRKVLAFLKETPLQNLKNLSLYLGLFERQLKGVLPFGYDKKEKMDCFQLSFKTWSGYCFPKLS